MQGLENVGNDIFTRPWTNIKSILAGTINNVSNDVVCLWTDVRFATRDDVGEDIRGTTKDQLWKN